MPHFPSFFHVTKLIKNFYLKEYKDVSGMLALTFSGGILDTSQSLTQILSSSLLISGVRNGKAKHLLNELEVRPNA